MRISLPFPPYFEPDNVATYLAALAREYEAGDPKALLYAIEACARERHVLPEWAAVAFLRCLARWARAEVATFDEALGFKPSPDTKPRRTAWRREEQRLDILYEVLEYRKANPDGAIDAALFARLGAASGMSPATAKRRYYEALREPVSESQRIHEQAFLRATLWEMTPEFKAAQAPGRKVRSGRKAR